MGFNLRGDKSSLALLSSKRGKAYSRTKADEAFALPSFSDAAPPPPVEPPPPPVGQRRTTNAAANAEHRAEQDSDNVKQTMLQHETVFKEQLHELHRLYRKQCVLMAEPQKGHACHTPSEPPSLNSSLLYNSDSFKPQDDRSFGDASVSKPFDKNQNLNVLPAQVDNVKPSEADAERQKQGWDRPILDLERPAEGRPMLDLERPADHFPCFDLERPAEEYIDVEVGRERAHVTGLTCTVSDASVLSNRQSVKVNRDFITGESRGLMPGKDKESWRSNKLAVCAGYDCKDTFGSKEGILEGYSQHGGLGLQPTACKEDYSSPMVSFTNTLDYSCQYSFSHPVEAVSTSGPFGGLPDLNGELSSAENQASHLQIKPDKRVNYRQYIDLEADSRASNGTTSKLPHWLVQPPPKALRMSVPTNCSNQTSEWQQKTTFFSPQVHASPKSLVACMPSPGEMMKASTLQEPYHPWSYINTPHQHREISFKEPLSFPSQFFSGENAGAVQGSHGVTHVSGLANESIPSFLPYVRDNAKMSVLTPLQNSPFIEGKERLLAARVSPSMDRQDIVFDARAASMELLSRISSKTPTAVSPVLPWYQQKESFSSLLHQASIPEPPFYRASYVPSVDPWEATARHQVLPRSGGVNTMERDVDRMHSAVSNSTGPCLVPKTESHTKGPVFDFLPSSTEKPVVTQELSFKGIEATTTWKQVEKPFYIGQIAEKVTSTDDDHSMIRRRNVFDLNMSCESLPSEENLDAHHFTDDRFFHANQIQGLKQECETISSSDWDMLRGNKAPLFNAQQIGSEPQAIGFADRTANQLMGFDVSSKDAAESPNDGSLFPRAGMLRSQRHRLASDTCAGYCSGEDETGGGFVDVKSSDASGLTSCESRDAAHFESAKARDDSNTSSGEACQSRESGVPYHKEDVALSSNVQSKRTSALPLAKAIGLAGSQQWGSFFLLTMQSGPGLDTKGDCSTLICTEFGDESEAAKSIARTHTVETADAAEVLLSLGLEVSPVSEEGYAISGNEKSLDWLANIIPQEENCEAQVLGVDMAGMAMHTDISTQPASMDVAEKIVDPFESAVLALEPIDPDVESLAIQSMDGSLMENCCSLPNLRRRPSRRGRAGKDFQREMLRSITPLSRQEIAEDFQIIEGLIYSTTEAVDISSLFLEDKPMSSPDSGSQKTARGSKACRGRKLSGTLNVCSWGDSSRRKRMGRQRSQWSCLPPRVESSPFVNNTGDGGPLM